MILSRPRRVMQGERKEDMNNAAVEKMRKDGYPFRIKGNGGYLAVLCDIQPLFGRDYMAVYRYPGGECCHDLEEIKRCFEVIEQ